MAEPTMTTLTALQHALVFLEELDEGADWEALRVRVRYWLPKMQEAEKAAELESEL